MRTVAETAVFVKYAAAIWSDSERNAFIAWIAHNPHAGVVIPGSGGCKKVRREVSSVTDEFEKFQADLLDSVQQMRNGEAALSTQVELSPVAAARAHVGVSQREFAALLGVSPRTLQDWEQGRRVPTGAARTLLLVAVRHPEALRDLSSSLE